MGQEIEPVDGGIVVGEHEWIHGVERIIILHKPLEIKDRNERIIVEKKLDDLLIQLFLGIEDLLKIVDELDEEIVHVLGQLRVDAIVMGQRDGVVIDIQILIVKLIEVRVCWVVQVRVRVVQEVIVRIGDFEKGQPQVDEQVVKL